jgi:hypothetical protein
VRTATMAAEEAPATSAAALHQRGPASDAKGANRIQLVLCGAVGKKIGPCLVWGCVSGLMHSCRAGSSSKSVVGPCGRDMARHEHPGCRGVTCETLFAAAAHAALQAFVNPKP